MARRSVADVSTGALTGAGTGAMIGAQVGGGYGAVIGGVGGGILGGVGAYFSGQQDQPYDSAQLQNMGIQNRLGVAQLDKLEEEEKARKRMEKMKRMFSGKIGRAYKAVTRSAGAI